MAEYEALAPLCMFVGRSHLGPLPRPSGAMLTPGGGAPTLESLLYHISVSHQRARQRWAAGLGVFGTPAGRKPFSAGPS